MVFVLFFFFCFITNYSNDYANKGPTFSPFYNVQQRTRELDTPDLLEQLPALQQLLFRLLACQVITCTISVSFILLFFFFFFFFCLNILFLYFCITITISLIGLCITIAIGFNTIIMVLIVITVIVSIP